MASGATSAPDPGTGRLPGFALLTVSVVLVSAAQILFKLGMLEAPEPAEWLTGTVSWLVLLGLGAGCYGCSMLAWLGALARLPVSLAYPMLSLSFLLVTFGAAWIPALAEDLHPTRTFGVVLVLLGNAAVAWSAAAED